jgi:hypothetical protein
MATTKNYQVWCTDGRYDENYFIKAISAKEARSLVGKISDGKVRSASIMTAEDLEDFEINPDAHEVGVAYLFDEGT